MSRVPFTSVACVAVVLMAGCSGSSPAEPSSQPSDASASGGPSDHTSFGALYHPLTGAKPLDITVE